MKIFYRFLLILLFFLFFFLLFYKNFVPEGKLILVKDFCLENKFISDLYPEERVKPPDKEKCEQAFFNEPVYFRVQVPRIFTGARVKLVFSNAKQPIIQLGVLRKRQQPTDWDFQMQLLENKIFDKLSWYKIEEDGISFWQKKKRFDSLAEFLNNLPMDQKTACFFYEIVQEAIKDRTKVVRWNEKTPLKYVDYIVSAYRSPLRKNGDLEKENEFLIGPDFINQGTIEFMISSPKIEDRRLEITLKKIEIVLEAPKLNFSNFWPAAWDYLKRKIKKDE